MKKYLKAFKMVFLIVLIAIIAALSVALQGKQKQNKNLMARINEQSMVIDSLLNRKEVVFEVQLNVTDKTKTTIYGRYNRGTINVPQEKVYKLEVDSVNLKLNE